MALETPFQLAVWIQRIHVIDRREVYRAVRTKCGRSSEVAAGIVLPLERSIGSDCVQQVSPDIYGTVRPDHRACRRTAIPLHGENPFHTAIWIECVEVSVFGDDVNGPIVGG